MFRIITLVAVLSASFLNADEDHSHHHGNDAPVERPKVYLDKSPKIVAYQLKRLDNARLLLVETGTDDAKYAPVFQAILLRPGMARKNRDEALQGLTAINKSDVATELLSALSSLDADDKEQQRVGRQLSGILLQQPTSVLTEKIDELTEATSGEGVYRATGFAGLITAGKADDAWTTAQTDAAAQVAYLSAVSLVPSGEVSECTSRQRGRVIG